MLGEGVGGWGGGGRGGRGEKGEVTAPHLVKHVN